MSRLRRYLAWEILGKRIRIRRKKRRGPPRDWRYRDFIHSLECTTCGAPPRSEVAHIGSRGMGQKCSDYETIPLCTSCHLTSQYAYHRLGKVAFEAFWDMDCLEIAKDLVRIWREQ